MLTLEEITAILHKNKDVWLDGTHNGNNGNQGNTIEKLLGVEENNLTLPDLGEIELKTQKLEADSYITLFHKEPQPRASIPKLLKCLGWKHKLAGLDYGANELSFRSTTHAHRYTNRGFTIKLTDDRIEFVFDPQKINHSENDTTGAYRNLGEWLLDIEERETHYSNVLPVYWDRAHFDSICRTKLDNTLMCFCETQRANGKERFKLHSAFIYKGFLHDNLTKLFHDGAVVIDFDARTGHNHGTKLRVKRDSIGKLFRQSEKIL